MCKTPKKESGNVIQGPWKNKREVKVPDVDVAQIHENIKFCDDLTEALMVQLIHTINENDFDVNSEEFLRDVGFIIESVRSMLYREVGVNHPMTGVIKAFTISEAVTSEDDEVEGYKHSINDSALEKILKVIEDEEEDTDPPKIS